MIDTRKFRIIFLLVSAGILCHPLHAGPDVPVFDDAVHTCRLNCPGPVCTSPYPDRSLQEARVIGGVPVPWNFPRFEIQQDGETAPGFIFTTVSDYIMILNNDGTPVFYRRLVYPVFDLMVHPDGILSYCDGYCTSAKFVLMDDHYTPFDTLTVGHGYKTGGHDFLRLPDGHTLFIGISYMPIDMSGIVPGGRSDAYRQENSLIELDGDRDIVFEWHCRDHYNIADATDIDLTQYYLEYSHINSISLDYDGQLIISNRPYSEVLKIDHDTGEIIWRFGGVYNQFTFVNEPLRFSFQHSARPVPGKPGHYTVYDNGNLRDPRYSRVVEYRIDETAMTAEKVWSYDPPEMWYSYSQGNAQRLSDNHTLINWGSEGSPLLTEVTEEGDIVYEITGANSDRSFRFEWDGAASAPYLLIESYYDHLYLIFNQFGASGIMQYHIFGDTLPDPVRLIKTTDRPCAYLLPADLPANNADWYFRVTSVDQSETESDPSNLKKVPVRFVDPGENMLYNGDFGKNEEAWELVTDAGAQGALSVDGENVGHVHIQNGGYAMSSVRLVQPNIKMKQGAGYQLEFDAKASGNRIIETHVGPYRIFTEQLRIDMQHFSMTFPYHDPDDYQCRLEFHCGGSDGDFFLDNVVLKETGSGQAVRNPGRAPGSFVMMPNSPNPFNSSTWIRYTLTESGFVTLDVLNLTGQTVDVPVRENQSPGIHQIRWAADGFPSGIYICRIDVNGTVRIKKMILQK
ncbi:aryl-sulfate sulfotransferase [bacterium]|nr:aryl-sulfate sulfotransferase [bacterium]